MEIIYKRDKSYSAENEGLIEYYTKNGFEHIDGRYVLEVQNEQF